MLLRLLPEPARCWWGRGRPRRDCSASPRWTLTDAFSLLEPGALRTGRVLALGASKINQVQLPGDRVRVAVAIFGHEVDGEDGVRSQGAGVAVQSRGFRGSQPSSAGEKIHSFFDG